MKLGALILWDINKGFGGNIEKQTFLFKITQNEKGLV